MSSSEYHNAYEAAQRELNDLLSAQQKTEKRMLTVRQALELLKRLCDEEDEELTPSANAAYLLEKSTLTDEIRSILIAEYPKWMRPRQIKERLVRLGHDLSKYSNAQAAIHMVLKRWTDSRDVQEWEWPEDGKNVYRVPRTPSDWDDPYSGKLAAGGVDISELLTPINTPAAPRKKK